MNSVFSSRRFGYLAIAHWIENRSRYIWFIGISLIVDVIFILVALSSAQSSRVPVFDFDAQVSWYATGLFLTGSVFAGLYFKGLSQPGSSLIYLMRPASNFEKWLLTFLVTGCLFPLIYTAFFALLKLPAIAIDEVMESTRNLCNGCEEKPSDFRLFIPFLRGEEADVPISFTSKFFRIQAYILLMFWSVQALILSGSVFYKNYPILKTVLTLFLLLILIIFMRVEPQMGAFWSPSPERIIPYSLTEIGLSIVLWAGIPALLWLTLYYFLTEREIA